jgi:hypothetical protein
LVSLEFLACSLYHGVSFGLCCALSLGCWFELWAFYHLGCSLFFVEYFVPFSSCWIIVCKLVVFLSLYGVSYLILLRWLYDFFCLIEMIWWMLEVMLSLLIFYWIIFIFFHSKVMLFFLWQLYVVNYFYEWSNFE